MNDQAQPSAVPADDLAGDGIYLVIELTIRDRDAMLRYLREVTPMLERYGGKIVGLAPDGRDVVEGEGRRVAMAVHRWPSREAFDRFYASPEYQPLKRLRHDASEARIAVVGAIAA